MCRRDALLSSCAIIFIVVLSGCLDVQPGTPPAAGLRAYVGAHVCSSCHRSSHAAWTATLHSDALSALKRTGSEANAYCLPCHTVGYGQATGYVDEVSTPQLANVQCENCHGAGGSHVANPQQSPMDVPLAADVCGKCHTGFHHPTADQWAGSAHAVALTTIQQNTYARDACLACHSAEAILATGENVVISLALSQQVTVKAANPITCQVCHAAHGSPNDAQLREPASDICLGCHTTGGTLPGNTPHHPQREMLLGLGGREATGAEAIGPNSGHTDAVSARCVRCHVHKETPVDPSRDNPVNTGHTFLPSVPGACTDCHPGAQATEYLEAARTEVSHKVAQLAHYYTPGDPLFVSRAGLGEADQQRFDVAKFNVQLVEADASWGAHNLDYARRLLQVAEGIFTSLGGG